MSKTTVVYAERYDAASGVMHRSTRMYTLDAIKNSKILSAVPGTETEIELEDLVPGEGWTRENYVPKK
jgi:hypothetical protein